MEPDHAGENAVRQAFPLPDVFANTCTCLSIFSATMPSPLNGKRQESAVSPAPGEARMPAMYVTAAHRLHILASEDDTGDLRLSLFSQQPGSAFSPAPGRAAPTPPTRVKAAHRSQTLASEDDDKDLRLLLFSQREESAFSPAPGAGKGHTHKRQMVVSSSAARPVCQCRAPPSVQQKEPEHDGGKEEPTDYEISCFDEFGLEQIMLVVAMGNSLTSTQSLFKVLDQGVMELILSNEITKSFIAHRKNRGLITPHPVHTTPGKGDDQRGKDAVQQRPPSVPRRKRELATCTRNRASVTRALFPQEIPGLTFADGPDLMLTNSPLHFPQSGFQ